MRKKNRRNTKATKRGNAPSGRRKSRHVLNVRASSKRAARARWGSRLKVFAKWGGAAALAIMLIVGVRRALDHFLYESPKFKISTIDFISDGDLTRGQVLGAAGIEPGLNILRVNLRDAREQILSELPLVKNVEIVRDLPDRLAFAVSERIPVAWLADLDRAGEPFRRRDGLLLDGEGVVVPCERLEQAYLGLPVIFSDEYAGAEPGQRLTAKQVIGALAILAEAKESFADSPVELEELRVANSFSLLGKLNTGAEITFGLDEIERQLCDLQVILAETTRRGRALATATVMIKKNIPVRFVPVGAPLREPVEDIAPRAQFVAPPPAEPDSAMPDFNPGSELGAVPRRRDQRSVRRPSAPEDPTVRSILGVD